MRSNFLYSGLGFIMPVAALGISSDPCITTSVSPTITVSRDQGFYINVYNRAYDEFCSDGLVAKMYQITQRCSSINCAPPQLETAPPRGFTCAVVECTRCGSPGTRTATLTFPTESIGAYESAGYILTQASSSLSETLHR